MVSRTFVGRKTELNKLRALYKKPGPSLCVIKGRRRIGKSRLITEFASGEHGTFWNFAGLAPQDGVTAQQQRDHFARQLALLLKIPPLTFHDWSDAFEHLSLHLQQGDIVLFDEISWMGGGDPTFIPKLKVWWDKQRHHCMLIFCGSVSMWIEENILKSTAFFGRVNLILTLQALSIKESSSFLHMVGFQGSAYDTYKLLSVLGGIPWYLEAVQSGVTANDMIRHLCFEKGGLLVKEFDMIFHDLFNGKGSTYKKILRSLKEGMKTLAQIRQAIHFARSGTLSQMMEHLIIAGFVKKQSLWSFKTGAGLKKSLYRISDPYMRFYLRVIEPHKDKIDEGTFDDMPISSLPGFEAHIGLQLEYLLLQNRSLVLDSVGVYASDVVCDGPYRQFQTSTIRGCQIDYLVQTRTKNLFVLEFKFKRRELGVECMREMKEKIEALKVPRGYAVVPVLFHISGVAPSVETAGYFYRIIDISEFLECEKR